ncbi:MAG: hypothetical protein ACI9WU_004115, partial [Myxococcota bacterium]
MLSVVPAAHADITLTLTASGGFYLPGDAGTGLLDANGTGVAAAYLLWAGPDGTIDPPSPTGLAGGDDAILDGFGFNAAAGSGSPYGDGWIVSLPYPYPAGVAPTAVVYLRIFEVNVPGSGLAYLDSPSVVAMDGQPYLVDANTVPGIADPLDKIVPAGCAGPVDCSDGNPCTDDVCTTGLCTNPPNAAPCDDGEPCTEFDTCGAGSCMSGGPVLCDDFNGCTDDVCAPGVGCQPIFNANPCDDGNICTLGDTCGAGFCNPGTPNPCTDGNACTDDVCMPGVGCTSIPNAAPCDDADACSVGDTCAAGACTPGTPLDCDDGFGCSQDLCNATLGCFYLPEADTTPCDDGLFCTENDACTNGGAECIGSAVDC